MVRLPLVTKVLPFYSSDTAVLDLMARHFLRGEFCLYYWGFHYYGVLDPILLMPLFRFLGPSPHVSQILPLVFSIVLLFCFHRYVAKIENPMTAHVSTLFLAAASPSFLQYTFTTYNYVFGPLLGFLFFLLAMAVYERPQDHRKCFLFGLLSGFAKYYFGLILFFWVATAAVWWMNCRSEKDHLFAKLPTLRGFWRDRILLKRYSGHPILKKLLVFVNFINLGNLLLAAVLWFTGDFVHQFGSQTVKLFFGPTFKFSLQAGIAVAAVIEWRRLAHFARAFWNHSSGRLFVIGYLLGYSPALLGCLVGNFPNVPSGFVPLPQIWINLKMIVGSICPKLASLSSNTIFAGATVLLLGGGLVGLFYRLFSLAILARQNKPAPRWAPMTLLFGINLVVGLFYMKLFDVGTTRYFLPAYFSVALGIAYTMQWISRFSRLAAWGLFGLLIANNLSGDWALLKGQPARPGFEILADELLARGCRGGYADYWTGYRLAAVTNERMIFAATGDNNLYPPYLNYARSLDHPVLIEEANSAQREMVTLQGTNYRVLRRETLANTPIAWLEKMP